MNEHGREVLRQAALERVPQAYGAYVSEDGRSYCAMGVLSKYIQEQKQVDFWEALDKYVYPEFGITNNELAKCSVCPEYFHNEETLITHLNDDHALDFLAIANKL